MVVVPHSRGMSKQRGSRFLCFFLAVPPQNLRSAVSAATAVFQVTDQGLQLQPSYVGELVVLREHPTATAVQMVQTALESVAVARGLNIQLAAQQLLHSFIPTTNTTSGRILLCAPLLAVSQGWYLSSGAKSVRAGRV